ncbi:hypothetical protein H8356DRAFT_1436305 [Neocallimastix lanati (nom. inval.)]|nr:hypothetical protein H8356DRAFT_1326449 [Neocallimastix sp. JGI-2020a]KAG4081771.1 hypothetical protein H8356DRAFT_1345922 [Neocallimastix sp. JGI-2020a]KAG4081774.1 hypothetical protein H8356DRAFT_1345926 [Neocallimastix sp. JGI-2020a]KAG4081777.1 hypothetical protein H8356DRAFT_1438343 [Neocallimastix sp. JGI-2020a]KAG4081886.1 hypothetical protein H8356DRAFT_1335379 [Neocallimastix sp. JGI-2020a]
MEIFYYGWIERLTTDQEVAGSIGYHVCLTHRRTAKSETDSAILAKYKISLSFQQNSEKTTKALMTRVRFPVNAFAFMAQSAEHPPNKAHWSSSMILALGARGGDTHHYTTWDERGANNAKQTECKIARLAQSVERETLNLKVQEKTKPESVALLAQLVERAAFNRKGVALMAQLASAFGC